MSSLPQKMLEPLLKYASDQGITLSDFTTRAQEAYRAELKRTGREDLIDRQGDWGKRLDWKSQKDLGQVKS